MNNPFNPDDFRLIRPEAPRYDTGRQGKHAYRHFPVLVQAGWSNGSSSIVQAHGIPIGGCFRTPARISQSENSWELDSIT